MTEEKYTEEVLDESEELHETALEEMADGDVVRNAVRSTLRGRSL